MAEPKDRNFQRKAKINQFKIYLENKMKNILLAAMLFSISSASPQAPQQNTLDRLVGNLTTLIGEITNLKAQVLSMQGQLNYVYQATKENEKMKEKMKKLGMDPATILDKMASAKAPARPQATPARP